MALTRVPQQLVNESLQLFEVAALGSEVTGALVAQHLGVTRAPHLAGLRVQPDDLLGPNQSQTFFQF